MNAVEHFARHSTPEAVRRLAALRVVRFDAERHGTATSGLDGVAARTRVVERWGDDLCGFLNAMTRGELATLAGELSLDVAATTKAPELRSRLWEKGAELERGLAGDVARALQPRPVLLGGHLVIQAPPRGMFPPAAGYPRALPDAVPAQLPGEEPDTLDDLLAAADRLVGVRLGARGRDKGAWGLRAAALLGVVERGGEEPDWRGDVEIKTVPVAREASGLWRIVEDPAIAMAFPARRSESGALHLRENLALAKLQRTLWLARADVDDGDATIVSWYLLDWDPMIARLTRRYLHVRPKGPAGTDQRGLYLSKRFFADAGLLATLNGAP